MSDRAGMERGLEVAERVLSRVGTGVEAEVRVTESREALTRFAVGFIHQNVEAERREVWLRVALDGRVAAASVAQSDDGALDALVGRTLDAARVARPDPHWPGLAPPAPGLDIDHWDDATAAATPDERADRVRAFRDAAQGLETAGYCSSEAGTVSYANTAGQRLSGRATSAALDGICRTGTADGSAREASARLGALDGTRTGTEAARRARDASDPTDLEPGRYEVVLGPGCVANLMLFLAVYGFNGRAVEEGRSFVRLGEQQFDPRISVVDDVTDPASTGIGFDAEGTPKRPVPLVTDGLTVGVCHDRRTAAVAGAESTGHAIEGGAAFGAVPSNLLLAPGDRTPGELVEGLGRGILVTDFWYTRILDPRTQVVTGLTRNGVWLVEDGRIVRPVANLRFTQSYVEALGPGQVLGVGSDRALVPSGSFGLGPAAVPSLHLASWSFTGGARG